MTWYQRRFTKYGNQTSTYNGILYHSKFEANYAAELDLLLQAGEITKWERQVKIDLKGENGSHITNYFIDFVVYHRSGITEYVECKGFETEVWRLKWKLAEDKFKNSKDFGSDIKLTLVKR